MLCRELSLWVTTFAWPTTYPNERFWCFEKTNWTGRRISDYILNQEKQVNNDTKRIKANLPSINLNWHTSTTSNEVILALWTSVNTANDAKGDFRVSDYEKFSPPFGQHDSAYHDQFLNHDIALEDTTQFQLCMFYNELHSLDRHCSIYLKTLQNL